MRKNYDPNDNYDLGNRDYMPIQITVRSSNQSTTIEIPWDSSAEQYIHAFYTAMIGISFDPSVVLSGMKEFADEHTEHYLEED